MSVFGSMNKTTVLEKYVGDNHSEFKIIERELKDLLGVMKKEYSTLLDRMQGEGNTNLINRKGPDFLNASKHNKKIEQQFKKFFGLKDFRLVWIQTGRPDAMTPCRSFTFMDKGPDENGRYKNENLTVSMMFDVNLVTYMDLNERETMAIILHEIGHNFYNSILQAISRLPISLINLMKNPADLGSPRTIQLLTIWIGQMGIMDLINLPKLLVNGREKIDSFLQKHAAPVMTLYRTYNEIMYNTIGFMRIPIKINPFILKGELPYLLHRFASTQVIFGYHTERFADNFAADHGYAQDLASAMQKMSMNKKNISVVATDNVPGINWMVDFIRVQMNIMHLFLDEHPREITRIRTGLNRLRDHAKDPNIDTKTRKDLEKEIEVYEKFYKDYLDLSKNSNKNRIFSWLYNVVVDKLFGGIGDIRELFWKLDSKSKI